MSIRYNLTVAEALELFLGGAECGLPESLLVMTERKWVQKFTQQCGILPQNTFT